MIWASPFYNFRFATRLVFYSFPYHLPRGPYAIRSFSPTSLQYANKGGSAKPLFGPFHYSLSITCPRACVRASSGGEIVILSTPRSLLPAHRNSANAARGWKSARPSSRYAERSPSMVLLSSGERSFSSCLNVALSRPYKRVTYMCYVRFGYVLIEYYLYTRTNFFFAGTQTVRDFTPPSQVTLTLSYNCAHGAIYITI